MNKEIKDLILHRKNQLSIIFGEEFKVPNPSRQEIKLYNRLKYKFELFYLPKKKIITATLDEEQGKQEHHILKDKVIIYTHKFKSKLDVTANFLTKGWILLEKIGKPVGKGKVKPYPNDMFKEIFEKYYKEGKYGWYEQGRKRRTEKGSRCGFEIPLIIEEMFPEIARKLGIKTEHLRFPTMAEYYLFEQMFFPRWKESKIREWTSTRVRFDFDGRKCLHYLIRKYVGDERFDYYFSDKVDGITGSDAVSPDLGFRFVIDLNKKTGMVPTRGWKYE